MQFTLVIVRAYSRPPSHHPVFNDEDDDKRSRLRPKREGQVPPTHRPSAISVWGGRAGVAAPRPVAGPEEGALGPLGVVKERNPRADVPRTAMNLAGR